MGEAKRRGTLQSRIEDSVSRDKSEEMKKKLERKYLLNRVWIRDNKNLAHTKKEK